MQSYPLISVVVPVYGVEQYIERCVDSLIEQSYENLEIILVDDGSPDKCPEICDRYDKKYSKIHTYHKSNGGLSDARNYGVKQSKSEWIVFVDSDDYVEKNYVSDLWRLKCQFNADMVATRTVRQFGDDTTKVVKKNEFSSYLATGKEAIYDIYGPGTIGWAAYGKLFNKDMLINYPFPTGFYEDCACMYKILNDCKKVAMGDYSYNYHYIQREGSILKSKLDDRHFHIFDICDEFDTFIKNTYPDMSILTVVFRKSAVVQLLNMQNMEWDNYKMLFYKYLKLFRKNLWCVLRQKRISFKSRIVYFVMCTNPYLYALMQKIVLHNRYNS